MEGRGQMRGGIGGVVGREWSRLQSSSQMMPWLGRLCERPWAAHLRVMWYGIAQWKRTRMSMMLRVVSGIAKTSEGGEGGRGQAGVVKYTSC